MLSKVTLWLMCAAILLLMIYLVPTAPTCWLPPNASTRGIYGACWGYWDLWA